MRALLAIIFAALSACAAGRAETPVKPVLSFSLTARNPRFTRSLGNGLSLRVVRDTLGWEAGVFRDHSTDNLLYPQGNWHGAFPCQLSAWSHRSRTFPDERVIAVRGLQHSVRIRLIDASTSGKAGAEQFAGGRVEIYWLRGVTPSARPNPALPVSPHTP